MADGVPDATTVEAASTSAPASAHYTKPSKTKKGGSAQAQPSRHLYVSGIGDALGTTTQQVCDIFSR